MGERGVGWVFLGSLGFRKNWAERIKTKYAAQFIQGGTGATGQD